MSKTEESLFDVLYGARTTASPLLAEHEAQETNEISVVLIDSTVLSAPILFAQHDDFESSDDIPVFYASELPHLRQMSKAELRRRYEQKRALGGGWTRDRIEESTKH